MTTMRNALFATAAAIGLTLAAMPADAAAVNCPGSGTGIRIFTVDTDPSSTCLGFGNGPLGGDDASLITIQGLTGAPLDLVLIDKSDNTTSGVLDGALEATLGSLISGLSGEFSITAPGYEQFVLVFQSGVGVLNPDWAAFLLGDTEGSWSISGSQALSHASLYGVRSDDTCTENCNEVPVPGVLGLLGAGLMGLGIAARRRRK